MSADVKLTPAQYRALSAADAGELMRCRSGYGCTLGGPFHAPQSIGALARCGLLEINALEGCMGTARITRAGRELLTAIRETRP